ncbi:MAG: CDP-diacylglycerol--serine O-phosphatidyltransferase [Gammaproteobacteria bacterium]|nr:MAG: CDP-diacylglycerol--serine O-phosphatidyltransferase [Gammaproteobacteria bacterium]
MAGEGDKPRRGIYLLPNLFTTAALFAGFYAIVAATKGAFEAAAASIFIAAVLDGMDGRIARLTNTQSAFGAEYDSLSDMISFGLAPALVAYHWGLHELGKLGWLAAFTYVAATALRLARFNTQVGIADKRYFQGLASPSAAGLVAATVWVGESYDLARLIPVLPVILVMTVTVALLMVSNIRYHSFKGLDFRGRVPFVHILVVVLLFVLISLDPPLVLFSVLFCYALSGPVMTLIELRRRRLERKRAGGTPPP